MDAIAHLLPVVVCLVFFWFIGRRTYNPATGCVGAINAPPTDSPVGLLMKMWGFVWFFITLLYVMWLEERAEPVSWSAWVSLAVVVAIGLVVGSGLLYISRRPSFRLSIRGWWVIGAIYGFVFLMYPAATYW